MYWWWFREAIPGVFPSFLHGESAVADHPIFFPAITDAIQPHGHGSRSEEYRKNIGSRDVKGSILDPKDTPASFWYDHLVKSVFFTHDLRSNPNSTLQALQVAEGLLGRRGWQGVRTGCRKPENQQGFNRKPGCYGAMEAACWQTHTIRRVVQIIHLSNPGEKRIRWEADEKQRFTSWILSAEVASGAKPGVQATGGGQSRIGTMGRMGRAAKIGFWVCLECRWLCTMHLGISWPKEQTATNLWCVTSGCFDQHPIYQSTQPGAIAGRGIERRPQGRYGCASVRSFGRGTMGKTTGKVEDD